MNMNQMDKKKTVPRKPKKGNNNSPTVAFSGTRAGTETYHSRSQRAAMELSSFQSQSAIVEKVEGRNSSFLTYKELEDEMDGLTTTPGLWLAAPHQMLGGQSPLQIAFTGNEGKQIVIDLIRMIKAGMFS